MSQFEYIMVLISLILGLGLTQLLFGVANLLTRWSNVKVYLPHAICIVVVFGLHVQEWWVNYIYSYAIETWHFSVFFSLLVYPIFLFIMARLLFPLSLDAKIIDLKQFYLANYRSFYFFGLLLVLTSIPKNILLLDMAISDQANHALLASIILIPVVIRTDKNWFHYGLSIMMFLTGLLYVLIFNPRL
ncbi:MAG: hypothetical protein OEX02_10555 [Cyclobacteriaceae bacterium]|nr:hypothetical protein [Cyclobacteriaceae bacterium]